MDVIKKFGSSTLTHLREGKDFVAKKVSSFGSRRVKHNLDNNPSKPEITKDKQTSSFQTSIKARLINLKKGIVSQLPFSKTAEAKGVTSAAEARHTENLDHKPLAEVLALPLPKDAKGLAERIDCLEVKQCQRIDSKNLRLALQTELEHLKFLHAQGPLSLEAHKKATQFQEQAANLVLEHLIGVRSTIYENHADRASSSGKLYGIKLKVDKTKEALNAYFEAKKVRMEEALENPNNDGSKVDAKDAPYKAIQAEMKQTSRDVAKILIDHNLHTPGTDLEELTKLIANTHNKLILNTRPWEPIQQDIYCYKQDGSAHKFTSVLTPALHLGAGFDYSDITLDDVQSTVIKTQEGKIDLGERTIQGLSSEMQHSRHTVNLWKSDLFAEGQDGKPKHLGSIFRHGVLCAYQDTADYRRKDKNLNRTKEVVTAMVHSSENLKAQVAQLKDGDTLRVPIVSTNLQSSSDAVALFKNFLKPAKNEKAHIKEQMEAWEALKKAGPFELEVDGKKILVQPEPITFNFGVNILAVRTKTKIAITWSSVKQANQKGMEALLGKAYLDGTPPDAAKLEKSLLLPETNDQGTPNPEAIKTNKAIQYLAGQIHEIYKSDAYQAQGMDPYKLVARISALSILSGKQTSINCKSGKDRTSTCDAEIKHILSTLEMHDWNDETMAPPLPYDQKLDDTARKNYQNFIFAKGNFALQEQNTGIAGYKCGGVPALIDKIADGSPFLKDLFFGGSKVAKG
jgi:hypothetical protein